MIEDNLAQIKARSARIPVTIVTGFLGSGKTTLLNRALRDPGFAHTAVIVNEFGDVGIDHDLIEASDDAVILLENGCLCCAVRSDLIFTLSDLYQRRAQGSIHQFDRVVIETSGLAEPTPVLEVLLSEPSINARYVPAGIVTTVDAVNGEATLNAHIESVQQLALADRVVVTKSDMAGAPTAASQSLLARIRALSPQADIVRASDRQDAGAFLRFTPEQLASNSWSDKSLDEVDEPHQHGHAHHLEHQDRRIQRFSIVKDYPWDMRTLELLLDALSQNAGPKMLRVKGIIAIAEEPTRPAVVHGAQNLVHKLEWLPEWPSENRRTRLVFITLDVTANEMNDMIDAIERMSARTRQARQQASLADASMEKVG
jgi:G3E family GTPase